MKRLIPSFLSAILLFVLASAVFSLTARADTFGSGANTFDIEFVPIGDAGNLPDTTGDPNPAGAVAYEYRIGKYEISESMIDQANALAADAGDPLGITHDGRGPNKPATRVSWFEAAQFVNWLNTSKGKTPAYKFDDQGDFQLWEPTDDGYDPDNLFRNTEAHYFLPSVDEWYKAAFYDPVSDQYFDFPNGKNTAPLPVASGPDANTAVYNQAGPADIMLAGGEGPYGTVAQGGNVLEWQESPLSKITIQIPTPDVRSFRGEDWGLVISPSALSSSVIDDRLARFPANSLGFRVACVPEPSAFLLLSLGGSGLFLRSRFHDIECDIRHS